MANDNPPTDKAKGKEPAKEEKPDGANATTQPEDKTTADGKKPTDLPKGPFPATHYFRQRPTANLIYRGAER